MAARSLWRRSLLVAPAFLLLAAALLLGNLWAFLRAPWGASILGAQVESRISAAIEGDLRIGALGTFSVLGFRLEDVLVLDPFGDPVIAVDDLRLRLSLVRLLEGELAVDIAIEGARVAIIELPQYDDVNIGLTFLPQEPAAPRPRRAPREPSPLPPEPPLPIVLRSLRIHETAFLFAEEPGAKPLALVRGISIFADGSWDERGAATKLDLRAQVIEPVAAPLELAVESAFAQDWLDALRVDLIFGATRLEVRGRGEMRALEGRILASGSIDARQLRAIDLPIASDVDVDLDLWLAFDRTTLALRARVEEGGVAAIDSFFEPRQGGFFAQAILAGVDPARWIEGAPRGLLSGSARAVGQLSPVVDLRLDLQIQEGELLGRVAGPVAISGRLLGERLQLDPSTLVMPGASLRLEGEAGPERVDLSGRIAARDLAEASRFVAELLGEHPPDLAGRGTLRFDLQGPREAPALRASLVAPRLAWEGRLAEGIELRGSGRIDPGGLPAGSLAGTIHRLRAGRLDALQLRIEAERSEKGVFSLDIMGESRVAGRRALGRTRLRAAGRLFPGRLELGRFRFDFPEGSLRSEGQATLDFGGGDFEIGGFVLQQRGAGRLAIRGGISDDRIDLLVDGRNLRLDRLPQALLPENLSGRVDLEAALSGTLQAPQGDVEFQLRDGALGGFGDLAAEGKIGFDAGRASGELRAAFDGAGLVVGSFSLPVDPLGAPATTPIALDLRIGPVDLQKLGVMLEIELPEALATGRIVGGGPIGAPDLELELLVSRFTIPDAPELPLLSARIAGRLHEGVALVDLEGWAAERRVLELQAEAPLDPRRLRFDFTGEIERMLRSAASRASGVVRGLDLELVGALIGQPDLRGAVVTEFDVRGPIVDPRGVIRFEARGGPVGPIDRLSVAALVELLPDRSRLVAGIALEDQPPAEIRAEVAAPPRAFIDGTAPASTPAELLIEIPSLDIGALTSRRGSRPDARARPGIQGIGRGRVFAGSLKASGSFRGTLATLPGSLRIIGEGLVIRGVPIGDAELSVEQGATLSARLDAIDPGAGTLIARASVDRDLSPLQLALQGAALFRGMQADIVAEGRDLTLQPLAMLSTINRAGGDLDFELHAVGPLADLDPLGKLSLRNGTIETVGGPRYEAITLDLDFAGEKEVRARLEAAAPGRGRLLAVGTLERGGGPDPFRFEVRSDSFPIGGPGGVSARISGEGTLEGEVGIDEGLQATLHVPRATIDLPPSPPRELQPVSRLRDVVIVTGPEAFLQQQKQRAAEASSVFPLSLRIDAPRRIFVRGEDVDAELEADLLVSRNQTGDLVAEGEVLVRRGTVRVLGRPFVVEDGTARWSGGPLENPRLAITVRYQARDVTAWVDVVGTAAVPQISLRSDPPLPESQIALLIAAGRTTLPGQTDPFGRATEPTEVSAASAAASVAGSFAAEQLRLAIGPRLPLDVLTLQTEGIGTRLEAGAYLSDRLYVGYLRNFLPEQQENVNEVRAEYELSSRVAIESRFGDRGAVGVDLVWEKRIATPGQQRARRAAYAERFGGAPPAAPRPGEPPPAAAQPPGASSPGD